MDNNVAMTEYLASFWNAEAVKKIREARDSKEDHAFQSDEDFEKTIVTREYKNNPILDAVRKLRENEAKPMVKNENQPRTKLPTDLSTIYSTLKKFNVD